MKIYAPVKNFNGLRNNVRFVNGVGESDNPSLIAWFESRGYQVESSEKCEKTPENRIEKCEKVEVNYINPVDNLLISLENDQIEEVKNENAVDNPNFDDMTPNELRDWMKENGYGLKIKNIRNKEKLLEIIRG